MQQSHFSLSSSSEVGRKILDVRYILRVQITAFGDRLCLKCEEKEKHIRRFLRIKPGQLGKQCFHLMRPERHLWEAACRAVFGHIKFQIPVRHLRGGINSAFGCTSGNTLAKGSHILKLLSEDQSKPKKDLATHGKAPVSQCNLFQQH